MEENINPSLNRKRITKIVFKLLYQILIIICFLIASIIALQKITNNNKSIAGYRIFRVITGSMEPEYDVGEVVISKEVNPKNIKVGDDIVYKGRYGDYAGKIIMHSVIAIEEKDGKLNFHAKGLHSSSVEDPQISQEQILGVVKYKSKLLTILYKWATNIYSVFIIIIVLVLNVFIAFRTPKKERIQQLSEPIDTIDEEEDEENEVDEEEDEDIEEVETEEENDDNDE